MKNTLKGLLEIKEGEVLGIASTEHPDRDGEIIKQEGWDLKNFKKNPVIMLSHNYQELPIGKATNIKVEDNKLVFKAIFSEATQKAKEAYQLVQEGILKSFSVGFIPREYDPKNQNVITNAELLEISLVAIPANPNAVVMAKEFKENDFAKVLVKEWIFNEELNKKKEVEKKEVVLCEKCKKEIKTAEDQKGEVKENGEDSLKGQSKGLEIDQKLLQKATGYLQELCRELKQKGGASK